jgi:hypothetical protein
VEYSLGSVECHGQNASLRGETCFGDGAGFVCARGIEVCTVRPIAKGSRGGRSGVGWGAQREVGYSLRWALLPGEVSKLRLQFVLEMVQGGGAGSCP